MQQNYREQGGVISYVIVGIILLGLLAGGVYLAKHQARIARDEGEPIAQSPAEQRDNGQNGETGNGGAADQEGGQAPQQPEETPSDESERPDGETGAPTTGDNGDGTDVPVTGPSAIAETGAAETATALIAVAALGATGTAYARSHRHLLRAHK